jgi:hypothetical protein
VTSHVDSSLELSSAVTNTDGGGPLGKWLPVGNPVFILLPPEAFKHYISQYFEDCDDRCEDWETWVFLAG